MKTVNRTIWLALSLIAHYHEQGRDKFIIRRNATVGAYRVVLCHYTEEAAYRAARLNRAEA